MNGLGLYYELLLAILTNFILNLHKSKVYGGQPSGDFKFVRFVRNSLEFVIRRIMDLELLRHQWSLLPEYVSDNFLCLSV